MLKKTEETLTFLRQVIRPDPIAAIVLGTGLGGLAQEIRDATKIPYKDIPNFPLTTVDGHEGHLISGTLGGRNIVALQGRFHFYEGYTLREVTFPVRVLSQLGIRYLFLSNASGGLNPEFEVGDLMFVRDHINLMNANPLTGLNDKEYGERFVDMSCPYDPVLLEKASAIADSLGIHYRTGVYAGVTGPTFETPSEYQYIRYIGADAVGMSTVPEAIVARQLNKKVFAVSVISDLGVKGKIVRISHEDVIDAASIAEPKMTRIILKLLEQI